MIKKKQQKLRKLAMDIEVFMHFNLCLNHVIDENDHLLLHVLLALAKFIPDRGSLQSTEGTLAGVCPPYVSPP